jgi:hypothetical protein
MTASTITELLSNNNSLTASGLASLGNGNYFALDPIFNNVNQDFDFGFQLKIKTGTSGVSSSGTVNIFAAYSADGGSTFPDSYLGTAGAITPVSPPNSRQIGQFNAVANGTSYTSNVVSVAAGVGYAPGVVGIIIQNNTGASFDATGSNFKAIYERLDASST